MAVNISFQSRERFLRTVKISLRAVPKHRSSHQEVFLKKVVFNPLSETFLGAVQNIFMSQFTKTAYFQCHLQMTAAITFVYITQILQTKRISFKNNVAVNEIIKCNISSGIKLNLIYGHLRNITSRTNKLIACELNISQDKVEGLKS